MHRASPTISTTAVRILTSLETLKVVLDRRRPRTGQAQPADRISACSITVLVALSCLSGGYPYLRRMRLTRQRRLARTFSRSVQSIVTLARTVRWSHFFGQVAKVYSGVVRRHWNGKEEAPVHGGFQEAGGAGGAAGARPGAGDRGALRGASEPGERVEAPSGRGPRRGVHAARIEARRGARGDDPGPAREDRRTDGGAGFFLRGLAR